MGVVIEDDGKTHEEFLEDISFMNDDLNKLSREATNLINIINDNVLKIVQ